MKLAALFGSAVVAFVSGCATAPTIPAQVLEEIAGASAPAAEDDLVASADVDLDPDHTYVCEQQPRTGSHIPRNVCRTLRQARQEREDAQERVRRASLGAAETGP